jgi:hypothetical protein
MTTTPTTQINEAQNNGDRKQAAQSGCCGGAAPKGVEACCARDAEIKSTGGSGCGCSPKATAATTAQKGCC